MLFVSSGPSWDRPGGIFGVMWAILGRLGGIFGVMFAIFGRLGGIFDTMWAILGRRSGMFDVICAILVPSWAVLGGKRPQNPKRRHVRMGSP